jgi:predicted DNA-binding transcriptional regulator AlpA
MRSSGIASQRGGHSIDDIIESYGLCRSTIYKAIGTGALRARKLGRRTVVLDADLRAWLDALPAIPPKSAA